MRLVLLLLFWLSAPMAFAACQGSNLLDALATGDPDRHRQIFERAEAVPNAKGRFWEVRHGDAPPSYLFGTYHAASAVDLVPPEIWPRIDKARVGIFELTTEAEAQMQARMASDPGFLLDMTGPPLSQRLPADQFALVSAAMQSRGVPADFGDRMRPWVLMSLLSFPQCEMQAMQAGALVLDNALAQRVIAGGAAEIGLETPEQALAAFRKMDQDVLLALLVDASANVRQEEDVYRTLRDLYAAGEIRAIYETGIWLSERNGVIADPRGAGRAMLDPLLDDRNRAWMPVLVRELRRGNAFVGVGALHLPGDVGLIELLRAEGFTVTLLAL